MWLLVFARCIAENSLHSDLQVCLGAIYNGWGNAYLGEIFLKVVAFINLLE